MVMVQGVGTATGPTFVVVTITLPRNNPVALSVPADVTSICAWQKLAFAFTVGGSCDGSSAFGFALRSHAASTGLQVGLLMMLITPFKGQQPGSFSLDWNIVQQLRHCVTDSWTPLRSLGAAVDVVGTG